MAKSKFPVTPAIRVLRDAKAVYSEHLYNYEEKGGTEVSSKELGVDEHYMIKTIIMEDENNNPLICLMHGDAEISTKQLARTIGVKSISPCAPETANKHTGFLVGGTSPFGTRKKMPIYMENTIQKLPILYINGGKRGYLLSMDPREVIRILRPTMVNVKI